MLVDLNSIEESNEFLNTLLNNINSAVFILNQDLRIISFNDAFGVLFPKPEDDLLGELCGNAIGCAFAVESGKDCGTTKHCEQCSLRKSLISAFVDHVPTHKRHLKRVFYPDGCEAVVKHFLFSTKMIRYRTEDVILIVVDDVTGLYEQKLRLEDLNRMKNEFLGVAAHDLRTPMSLIRGFSQLLLEKDLSCLEDEDREILDVMNQQSDFCLKLLNELLDISRIEAGKLDLKYAPVDYGALLKQVVAMHQLFADSKHIGLSWEPSKVLPAVDMDAAKITQVLNNLVSNAIKYSPSNTTVRVEVAIEDEALLTRVVDQGGGIPAGELDGLFNAFQRTSVKPTGGEKSTGLGLAIARMIVEAHRGTIGVQSREGEGSIFYFRLPFQVPKSPTAKEPES